MLRNAFLKKILKISAAAALCVTTLLVFQSSPVSAAASDKPVIVAKIYSNGAWVPLGNNKATSTVRLEADRPVKFYMGDVSLSEDYSKIKDISKGYGSFSYYAFDVNGNASNTVTVQLDVNQPPILTGVPNVAGLETVKLNSMKDSYWIVNGVQGTELAVSKTFTAKGDYTVQCVGADGLKSEIVKFSIPTKAVAVTTTTTKKVTTTKKTNSGGVVTTTTPAGSVNLTIDAVENGGATNQDVVITANDSVFFVINGVKEANAAKTITIKEEGAYTVKAVNAKNKESAEYSFTIDKTAAVLSLKIDGEVTTESILEKPVTIEANEKGIFLVNGEEHLGTNNALVVSSAGTYMIEYVDMAGNRSKAEFVLKLEEAKPQSNNSGNLFLYILLGAVIGGGCVFGLNFFMNKKKQAGN